MTVMKRPESHKDRVGAVTDEFPKMNLKQFRDLGFLQEANRQFFHPLGMALVVKVATSDDGDEFVRLDSIVDQRKDPEGLYFLEGVIDQKKVDRVELLRASKEAKRIKVLGSPLQSGEKEGKPTVGRPVLAILEHWETGKLLHAVLKAVNGDDHDWETVDDSSEISHGWNVINWEYLPKLREGKNNVERI